MKFFIYLPTEGSLRSPIELHVRYLGVIDKKLNRESCWASSLLVANGTQVMGMNKLAMLRNAKIFFSTSRAWRCFPKTSRNLVRCGTRATKFVPKGLLANLSGRTVVPNNLYAFYDPGSNLGG